MTKNPEIMDAKTSLVSSKRNDYEPIDYEPGDLDDKAR